MIKQMIL